MPISYQITNTLTTRELYRQGHDYNYSRYRVDCLSYLSCLSCLGCLGCLGLSPNHSLTYTSNSPLYSYPTSSTRLIAFNSLFLYYEYMGLYKDLGKYTPANLSTVPYAAHTVSYNVYVVQQILTPCHVMGIPRYHTSLLQLAGLYCQIMACNSFLNKRGRVPTMIKLSGRYILGIYSIKIYIRKSIKEAVGGGEIENSWISSLTQSKAC